MSGFLRALDVVFANEGGLADNPNDRGGRTNLGITQGVWRAWLEATDQDPRPVDTITLDEARALYRQNYWLAGTCDRLSWPLSLVHFDSCVNHGVGAAAKLLQRALDVSMDGVIGPVTLGAAKPAKAERQAEDLLWVRADKYARIVRYDPSQREFIVGWIARLRHVRRVVLQQDELPA